MQHILEVELESPKHIGIKISQRQAGVEEAAALYSSFHEVIKMIMMMSLKSEMG